MNEDKYPTEEELKFIEEYNCAKLPPAPLIDYIRNIWWMPDWGFELKKEKDEIYGERLRLYISTGGWSGNEDIIRALKKNEWFYCFYWEQSRIGGHYIFYFDPDTYEVEK